MVLAAASNRRSESRAEISRLREELQTQRSTGSESATAGDEQSPAHSGSSLAERLDQMEEDQQLLSAKVDTSTRPRLRAPRSTGCVSRDCCCSICSATAARSTIRTCPRVATARTRRFLGFGRRHPAAVRSWVLKSSARTCWAHAPAETSTSISGVAFPLPKTAWIPGSCACVRQPVRLDWNDTSIDRGAGPVVPSLRSRPPRLLQ